MDFPNNPVSRWLIKKVLKKADAITATSNLLKRVCIDLLPASETKVQVIPFGVTVPRAPSEMPPSDTIKICFVKGHYKKYGPDILLKAMVLAKNKITNISLSIAGEGDMTPKLKRMVSELNLDDHVNFTGFVDNREIYNFIQQVTFL